MTDKVFVDGVKITKKETKFGTIYKFGIKAETFMDFIAKYINEKGYVNLDLKKSIKDKWYLELDTYYMNKEGKEQEGDNLCSFDDMTTADFDDSEVPF